MNADTNIEATFCFIDIAGYTALTYMHGEMAAAELVDDFAGLIRMSVEPLGELQSIIGDCAFVVFPDPIIATRALSALYDQVADRQNFPVVRSGLHHGPALLRGNRHFGTTVNVAAQVAAQATGGQILCTKPVVEILQQAQVPQIEVEHKGPASLKNVPEPVDLYEIVVSGSLLQYAVDPVCKMQVDKRRAAGDVRFNDATYWFCPLACVERFAGDPSAYVSIAPARASGVRDS